MVFGAKATHATGKRAMTTHRRTLLAAASMALPAGLARPFVARAQGAWPDRPVRLIVPFGAGGAVDTISRLVSQHFQPIAGQPLVVENRPGAGGTIAGAFVARERPDGNTLMMTDIGANAIGNLIYANLPYDPATAFTPVCHMVNLPSAVIARKDLVVAGLADMIAQAKAAPDKFTFASAGIGNGSHLFMELLAQRAGIKLTHVPYRSGAELATAVVKGETDYGFLSVSSGLQQIRGGLVKPIAVSSLSRNAALPDVPLVADVIPGFETNIWHGLAGPAGMPAPLVEQANRVFDRIAQLTEVKEAVARVQAGVTVGGSAENFGRFIAAEIATWTPLIQAIGIRAA
jgi:tripartite-type tricarboxylate transporter receptor subunit TctC